MVTINELKVPNVLPVIICKVLVDQFPCCVICSKPLKIDRQALVLRSDNKIVTVFHPRNAQYNCEVKFKRRFIKSHPKITQKELCRILNISRRQFFILKENNGK